MEEIPQFVSNYQNLITRKAIISKITNRIAILTVLYLVIQVFRQDYNRLELGTIMLAIMVSIYVINGRYNPNLAGYLLIGSLWCIFAIVYLLGPKSSFFISAFVIVFVYAFVLFGVKHLQFYITLTFILISSNEILLHDNQTFPLIFSYPPIMVLLLIMFLTFLTLIPIFDWYDRLISQEQTNSNLLKKLNQENLKYKRIFNNGPIGQMELDMSAIVKFVNDFQSNDDLVEYLSNKDNIVEIAKEVIVLDANPQVINLFGLSSNTVSFRGGLLHPDNLKIFKNILHQIYSGQTEFSEYLRSGDGKKIFFTNLKLYPEVNEEIYLGMFTLQDITKMVEFEHKIQTYQDEKIQLIDEKFQEEQKYRNLVDVLPMGIREINASGTIIYANEAFYDIYNDIDHSLLGKKIWETIPHADRENFVSFFENLRLNEDASHSYNRKNLTVDGKEIEVKVIWNPILDKYNDIEGFVSVVDDVTEDKRKELELKELLSEKEFLIKEIHHRIKNNLMIINSYIQLKREKQPYQDSSALIGDLEGQVKAIAHFYSNVTSKQTHIERLDGYFDDLISKMNRIYNHKELPFILHLEIDDTIKLKTKIIIPINLILTEFVSNTFKHGFTKNEDITVKVDIYLRRGSGNELELVYKDNGQGSDTDVSFNMGLNIASMLVQQIGGNLSVSSKNGFKVCVFGIENNGEQSS